MIPWEKVTSSGELIDRVRLTFTGAEPFKSLEECYGHLDLSVHELKDNLRRGTVDRQTERHIESLMATLTQIYYTLPQL